MPSNIRRPECTQIAHCHSLAILHCRLGYRKEFCNGINFDHFDRWAHRHLLVTFFITSKSHFGPGPQISRILQGTARGSEFGGDGSLCAGGGVQLNKARERKKQIGNTHIKTWSGPTQEAPPSPFWQFTRTMVWVSPGRKLGPWSEFPFLYRLTVLLNSGGSNSPWSEFWSEFPHFMGMGVVPAPSIQKRPNSVYARDASSSLSSRQRIPTIKNLRVGGILSGGFSEYFCVCVCLYVLFSLLKSRMQLACPEMRPTLPWLALREAPAPLACRCLAPVHRIEDQDEQGSHVQRRS